MKVQMRAQISGTINGAEWPAIGDVLEVPDDEGARLCASGQAVPVAEPVRAERAVAPRAESRAARKKPAPDVKGS